MSPQPALSGMTQASVRSSNLALVLRRIARESGTVSRADIAGQLGMTRSTVSRLVDDLVLGHLVVEGEAMGGVRGRPAVPLALSTRQVVALGLEVNLDRIVGTIVDLPGGTVAVSKESIDAIELGFDATMADVVGVAEALLAQVPGDARLAGAVLAVPGLVEKDGRRVMRSPNLGWDGLDPSSRWDVAFRGTTVPLRTANDVDCSARTLIRESPDSSFLYITGEVGIGSAISMGGQLLTGRHGWASELGHMCVEPGGVRCGCGSDGCLETVVGRRALLTASGQPDLDALCLALQEGDPEALATITRAAEALGIAVGGALNLLDLTTVNLGGHLGVLGEWLNPLLATELKRRVLWSGHSDIELASISQAPLRAAMGAGMAALGQVLAEPADWVEPLLER